MEGISFEVLSSRFGVEETAFISRSKKFIDNNLLKHVNDSLVLTNEGKLLADGIASDLFY